MFGYFTAFPIKLQPDPPLLFTASKLSFTPTSLADLWLGYVKRPSHMDASRTSLSSRSCPPMMTPLCSPAQIGVCFQTRAHGWIWKLT